MHPLLILGAGYVGDALWARYPDASATHRPGKPFAPKALPFQLEDPATWGAIPAENADIVWTFPPKPLDLVQRFYHEKLSAPHSLIVLGSTSAYLTSAPAEVVTEDTPLDFAQERVAGEEWLRLQGATVLQLAGIFGPNRSPLEWLKKGLIKNGRKRVNLIHVDDILAAIEALREYPHAGERINLSNGLAPEWNELVLIYKQRGELPPGFSLPQEDPGMTNKVVRNDKLKALLPGCVFRRP